MSGISLHRKMFRKKKIQWLTNLLRASKLQRKISGVLPHTVPPAVHANIVSILIDLRDYDSLLSVGAVDAFSNLNPLELTKIDNWQDPLLLAIIYLNWQREQILKSWLNESRRGR